MERQPGALTLSEDDRRVLAVTHQKHVSRRLGRVAAFVDIEQPAEATCRCPCSGRTSQGDPARAGGLPGSSASACRRCGTVPR